MSVQVCYDGKICLLVEFIQLIDNYLKEIIKRLSNRTMSDSYSNNGSFNGTSNNFLVFYFLFEVFRVTLYSYEILMIMSKDFFGSFTAVDKMLHSW